MPPALAALALGAAGMVGTNMQQKATIKDAENAKTTAQADATKAEGTATDSMQKYLAAHPGPAGPGNAPSAAPAYSGSSIPLAGTPAGTGANPASALNTMAGASGIPPTPGAGPGPGMMSAPPSGGAGKSLPPAVLAMLKQAMSGQA